MGRVLFFKPRVSGAFALDLRAQKGVLEIVGGVAAGGHRLATFPQGISPYGESRKSSKTRSSTGRESMDFRMNARIRTARYDEAPFLSWLILTAGRAHVKRGIWEAILGQSEQHCLRFFKSLATTTTTHLFHYTCYLVAEWNGAPAAGLGGYDPRELGHAALQRALGEVCDELCADSLRDKLAREPPRILDCIPETLEGAWVIDSVATAEPHRRKGLVGRLLEEILQRGRTRGFRKAQINIYIGNIPALHTYRKHGFRIMDEKRDSYFETEIGSPGMARLVRNL